MSIMGAEFAHEPGAEDREAARLEHQAEGLVGHVLRQVRAGHIGEPILTRTSRLGLIPKELSATAVDIADGLLATADLTITAHDRRRKVIIPGHVTVAQDTITVERIGYSPRRAGTE